jgi:hypothetical protein
MSVHQHPLFQLQDSSLDELWQGMSTSERVEIERWVEDGHLVNEAIRHSFTGEINSWPLDCIHQTMQRAARIAAPGQVLWRGSAWPVSVGAAWRTDEYTCCSLSPEVAESFARNPAWPWPNELHVDEHVARPGLARIEIGEGVKAVPVSQLLEAGLAHRWQAPPTSEQEVVLLACSFTVVEITSDWVSILAQG